jgi:diguanylate cyclase (GGDEF)-like protein
LANRRLADEGFQAEWRRASRDRYAVGFLMIDVDQFKKYNDRYGQPMETWCSAASARCWRQTTRRPGDLAARMGGEEFAVLLPRADLRDTAAVGEQIRVAVEALGLEHKDNASGCVTVSIGAASACPGVQDTVASLIEGADAAVYRAKRSGRNRVALQEPALSLAS